MSVCSSGPVAIPAVVLPRGKRTRQGLQRLLSLPSYPYPSSLFPPQISTPHSAGQMNAAHPSSSPRTELVNTPHPDNLYLPWSSPATQQGQDYYRWEYQQQKLWFARQSERKTPPSDETFDAERRFWRELVEQKRSIIEKIGPIFSTLPAHERAETSARLAKIVWQEKIVRCRLARVHKFPPEIIVHVLSFLLDFNPEFYRIRLSSVCRQWREIVVKMPRLWQEVWLNDTAPHTVSESFMERAQSLPLKLRIGEHRPKRSSPTTVYLTAEEMHRQLDVVLPRLGQIRDLSVIVHGWPACFAFLERAYTCPVVPSQLENFRLHRTSAGYGTLETIWSTTNSGRHLLLFGGRATCIRQLIVDGVHLDWSIPLSDLDILDLRRMPLSVMPSWPRFSEVIHLSSNLRELKLDGCSPKFSLIDADLPRQRILLPGLRTLQIGGMSIPVVLRMSYLLDAPRLIELMLKNYENDIDWSPVFQMLTGLYPVLRILHLNAVRVSQQPQTTGAMTRFFMSMKNVELLRLIDMHESFLNILLEDGRYYLDPTTPPVMTSVMRREIEAAHPEPLRMLPALKTVVYTAVLTQEIIRFTNSRRTLGLPLKRLYSHVFWFRTLSLQEKYALSRIEGFRTLEVGLNEDACPEEQAVWRDVEGPGAAVRKSRV
ncbi:hypothetical protein PENSPDRAFT_732003 [Peniophora sp. CONT]|nr:hypothetical protein PENSPDRAFT_732003 [Peniophora sp. CONT]